MKKLTGVLPVAMLCLALAGPAAAATYSFNFTGGTQAITDGSWVNADINVGGDLGDIADVNVFLDITHTWIGDLDIYVAHQEPGSSAWKWVQLYNDIDGDSRNNMTDVLFDDQALIHINDGIPPYGPGSFKPTSNPEAGESNLLSDYNGDAAAGIWSLAVFDNATGDFGSLLDFRVDVVTDAVPLPGAIVFLGSGLAALAGLSRRRKQN
ncbi:MAG: hypothetical protein HY885_02455 [Deltaproteobacteria bacterium]|nr:hypothetical protein [Deltaproteobacteria bacterium]